MNLKYYLLNMENLHRRIASSILVAVVGDAFAVPIGSSPRYELSLCSVKNMLGYGRYDHPQGTWSDDSSMMFCTMESMLRGRYDLEDIGQTFCRWMFDSHWTPNGYVFDAGLTTFLALDRIRNAGISARHSGGKTEEDNGNGSLMRILPAALYFHNEDMGTLLERIHEVSAITHAHPRSLIGCGIYSLLIKNLLSTGDKEKAIRLTAADAAEYYRSNPVFRSDIVHYNRILLLDILNLSETDISSSGYIIDTLETSIWCFLHYTNSYDIILSAVELGLDTDTTGVVAGGLAGLLYGTEGIPEDWIASLARHDEILDLIERFAELAAAGK